MGLKEVIAMAAGYMGAIYLQQETHKKEILAEWELSKNYPRKKKKRVRKELNIRWAFANFDPFKI